MERNSPDIEPAQESSTLARSRLRKTVRAALSESVSALSGLFRTSSRMTREDLPSQGSDGPRSRTGSNNPKKAADTRPDWDHVAGAPRVYAGSERRRLGIRSRRR